MSLPEFKSVRTADLMRLLELLPPPDVQVGDKMMRFQDPNAHDMLAAIRDAINALADGSRYAVTEVAPSINAMAEEIRSMPRYDCVGPDGDYGAGMESGDGYVDYYELLKIVERYKS